MNTSSIDSPDFEARARRGMGAILVLAATFAGGLFMGYLDLTSSEVQGPALILMIVSFLCALPRQAPAWATALAAMAGLPAMHWLGSLIQLQGADPSVEMLIALVPSMLAAYVGVAVRIVLDEVARALRGPVADVANAATRHYSLGRPAIVFGGLAACAALGLPLTRNVLYYRRDIAQDNAWWIASVWQLVTLVAWCAIAVVIVRRYAARATNRTPVTARTVLRHAALLAAAAVAHTFALVLLARVLFIPLNSATPGWGNPSGTLQIYIFLANLPLDALAYMTILLLVYATDSERIEREANRRTTELTAALDQSRLAALNAQLRPHFMFNALNSVVVLARRGDASGADAAASDLAEMMRYVLDENSAERTSLRDEFAFIESYLKLEQLRFSDRLKITLECEERLADAVVPRLLLQPVVENAVRHGIAKRIEEGHIRVSARRLDDVGMEITVEDDGPGMKMPADSDDGPAEGGLGLRATRSRLATLYDGRAHLWITSLQPHGTRVRFELPLQMKSSA